MKRATIKILIFSVVVLIAASCGGRNNHPTTFKSDDDFLDFIEHTHLNYMWEGAEPTSGLAPERIQPDNDYPLNDADVITTGGSGFGIMGLIVGIERGFIDREEGVARFHKIADYLAKADRFHGVWPHWIKGPTGKTVSFGEKDNGADLVESSFLMQGLLCARQYFRDGNESERELASKIDTLWREMEFSFFQQDGRDVLYWHWSPDYGWDMNFALEGYNECLIAYILGASSPTYPIAPEAYHKGWARGGAIVSDTAAYGHKLVLRHNGAEEMGGPLFWAHYSYIGFCPKGTKDKYADYWELNRNHTLINHDYCVENSKGFAGYGEDCWGLTASYSGVVGYTAHAPNNDLGVITPTAALSSFPYTPEESMRALRYFYFEKGDALWGKYGFYDAFSSNDDWYANGYLAIDQCTIAPMIENHRTGLLWKLFMSAPEVKEGLKKLGFY